MATLYDMELQESNNFILALEENGMTPALKLMDDQVKQAASMGPAGGELVAQLKDPNTSMGKSYLRLQEIKDAIADTMQKIGMTPEMAKEAHTIFSNNPESLTALSEEQRKVINNYWLKKKTCVVLLLKRGYSHEELFS